MTDGKIGVNSTGSAVLLAEPKPIKVRKDGVATIVYPLLTTIVILLVWEASCVIFKIRTFILPPPSQVLLMIAQRSAFIGAHAWVTFIEIVVSFALSILVGGILALAITTWRAVELALYPILVISQAVPKVALAPLFILWLGIGWEPKVVVALLIAFFPIVIGLVTGFQSVPLSMRKLALSMGASRWQTFCHFLMPHALPHFFAGLKVAVTLAISGAIIGEFVGADTGLGYLLLFANGQMDTNLLFGVIVVLALLGVALFQALLIVEKMCLPWHISSNLGGPGGQM